MSYSIRDTIGKIKKNGNDQSYFLLGSDYFLQNFFINKIKENANSKINVDYYYLNDHSDIELFFNTINSISLFSNENIYIIKNFNRLSVSYQNILDKYLKNPDCKNILVFILDDFMIKNKFSKKISNYSTIVNTQTPLSQLKIKNWVKYYFKNEKNQISDNILNYFIENYKSDISSILNEAKKYYLSTYSSDTKMEYKNRNHFSKHIKVWHLLDVLGKKKIKESIKIYNNLYANGYSLVPIIINLNNFFFELLYSYDQSTKINYSLLNKTLQSRFNVYQTNFSKSEIKEIFLKLRDCDIQIKTSSINEKNLFILLIFKICNGYYNE